MMKINRLYAFFLIFSLISSLVIAQNQNDLKIDTGRIKNAMYRIVIPENWNHNLVMYAHGYEFPTMPSDPKSFHNARNDQSIKPYLDRGFAVARSAYRKKGWALAEGVDDTEALRKYFSKKYGKPDTCYITGHSMGGGITLATIENYTKYYNGAMPMCPLASRPYLQVKMTCDINIVFAAMFPDVIPPVSEVIKGTAPVLSMPAINGAIKNDTVLASAIAKRFELKPKDLAMVVMFNDGILRDIGKQAGGNPFDNTNTLYSGFPDDWEVNKKVERIAMTPGTEDFFDRYDRTGNTTKPTLLVQTIYDQLIPASMAVISYDNMVHEKGKQSNLVVVYTNGQGHCNFTPEETGKAFDLLRKWVSEGTRPTPGILE
jgi:pimeloyl-ACP methyl ester carboxylesterase